MRYIIFNLTVVLAIGYLLFQDHSVVQDWTNTASDTIENIEPIAANIVTHEELEEIRSNLLEEIERLEKLKRERSLVNLFMLVPSSKYLLAKEKPAS
mgnify:CR=1 FL=1